MKIRWNGLLTINNKPKVLVNNSWPLLFILLIFSMSGCKSDQIDPQRMEGVWLGVKQNVFEQSLPYTMISDFKKDGSLLIKSLAFSTETNSTWAITKEGKLRIDTLENDIVSFNKDTINTRLRRDVSLFKLSPPTVSVELDQTINIIDNNTFSIKETGENWTFEKDKVWIWKGKQLLEVRCWGLKSYKDYQFFYLSGYPDRCNNYLGRLMVIEKVSKQGFNAFAFNEKDKGHFTFELKKDLKNLEEIKTQKIFQPCTYYMANAMKQAGESNENGANYIESFIIEKYKKNPDFQKVNGFVSIKFFVNCLGESGLFSTVALDEQYQDMEIPASLSEHLIEIARKLEGWIPFEYEDENLDGKKEIAIHFKSGEIIAITP